MSQTGDNVAISIKKLVDKMCVPVPVPVPAPAPEPPKPTIFKVDDRLRGVNEKDYEPRIVSIGPIHHGKNHFKTMEQHKVRFLHQLLDGNGDLLNTLVGEVRKMEDYAHRCYSTSPNLDKDKFMEILVLDCFIIQLIRRYFSGKSNNDPIFETEKLSQIIHDLLLFENQLPFSILTTLFDKTKIGSDLDDNLRHLILYLVGDIVPWLDDSKTQLSPDPDHLLGLVYRCISTKIPPKTDGGKAKKSLVTHINSASELKVVGGIRIKMSEDNVLRFAGKDLKLPPLQVSGETESLLRNLMAYEQLQLGDDHPRHMIDYVFFLHCLVRSTKDVEILRYKGIISNYLGGDDKILDMLGRLGTNFMRSPEYSYSDVFDRLNRHCGRHRSKWMAILWRDHCSDPWSITKVSAATFLLLLAATQVIFAILSYEKQMTTMTSPDKN